MSGVDIVEGNMNDKCRNTEQRSKNKSPNPSISVGGITIVSDTPRQTYKHRHVKQTHLTCMDALIRTHTYTHAHTYTQLIITFSIPSDVSYLHGQCQTQP